MERARAVTRTTPDIWQPGTRLEQALVQAAARGDRDAYLRVLASCDLCVYDVLVANGGARRSSWNESIAKDRAGRWCVTVRTPGERLPRRSNKVPVRVSLLSLAEDWPDIRFPLCVNPGTPAEMTFAARPRARRRWLKAVAASAYDPRSARPAGLLTRYAGPRTGLLAQSLACGAHLAVCNGVVWNDIGDAYDDFAGDTANLRTGWGTTTHAGWREQMDALLDARNSPAEPEFALRVRRTLAERTGRPVPLETWRAACADTLSRMDAGDEVTDTVQELVGRIARYEARFRADGLLPPDGFVRSAVGYDYGRAVNFARWGLGARLCGGQEAREAVLRAGALAGVGHTSWADFSAGYALGRVLRFDTEEFGRWYEDVLGPHRILMSDPESPWLALPWE